MLARDVMTPEALAMLQDIAEAGSFAAAARRRQVVPSALTYRVRQMEDALDVLLFDRSSRQARLTEAGAELLREGGRMLADIDAVTHRIKRVATGWEPQLTIALDGVIDRVTVMELCEAFLALNPPSRLRLRDEVLSGTLDVLLAGQADLAIGVLVQPGAVPALRSEPIGILDFVYVVAPHHPLAKAPEPLSDALIRQHRAVAVADSTQRGDGMTIGLLPGQDVLTVSSLPVKLEAQLRGLGSGFIPYALARPYIETGRLVHKRVEREERKSRISYAWLPRDGRSPGKALQWWLQHLQNLLTRAALLGERPLRRDESATKARPKRNAAP